MNARQNVFPIHPHGLTRGLADEPVLIDGMKMEFDEKVALYPAAVEVTDDQPVDRRIRRANGRDRRA